MGNYIPGLYYDVIVNNKIKLEERDELYQYSRYFDAPDSMLFKTGYDSNIENNSNYKTDTMKKAVYRAVLDRDKNANQRERFIYLTGLPRQLIKDCAFQNEVKRFWKDIVIEKKIVKYKYDEETLRWVLKYKNIEECL